MRKYFMIMFIIVLITPACRKKSYSEKIVGKWIGAQLKSGGYKGTTDTLIIGADSTLTWRSNIVGANVTTRYRIAGDTVWFANGIDAFIDFTGTNCLHWQYRTIDENIDFYFTKQ
jgi:hypothetical protein